MDIARLTYLLNELNPKIELVGGYIFLDRLKRGPDGIKAEIAKYKSTKEAQSWINIVPLSEFITEFVGDDWEVNDPNIGPLLAIFEEVWTAKVQSVCPGVFFRIERWTEEDVGDLGLRLFQTDAPESA